MKIRIAALLAFVFTACGGFEPTSSDGAAGIDARASDLTLPEQAAVPDFVSPSIPVCPGPTSLGDARCHSHVVTDEHGHPNVTSSYQSGLNPSNLQSAYKLPFSVTPANPTLTPTGPTIAIVDAYDNPNAEADLGVYRSTFNLPPCTTANGCFKKVNQRGGATPPRGNSGWGLEIALDLQMASAICPTCRILLVEADSNSFTNLMAAVNKAASTAGVVAISNSYGAGEFSGEGSYESAYNHPGIAVTVSSGDSGYGVEFPAASQYVTAVGGTTLRTDGSTRGWSEATWSGAGSGCSAYITKPSWQHDGGCSRRTVADVSAVANPSTGVAVYDSYAYQGQKGWWVVGGTSVSSPIIASVFALKNNMTSNTYSSSYLYSAASTTLFDVASGSNGSCGGSYLCTAAGGYDGPTGLGTPNGTSAF